MSNLNNNSAELTAILTILKNKGLYPEVAAELAKIENRVTVIETKNDALFSFDAETGTLTITTT